jgi:hypothetical protein
VLAAGVSSCDINLKTPLHTALGNLIAKTKALLTSSTHATFYALKHRFSS